MSYRSKVVPCLGNWLLLISLAVLGLSPVLAAPLKGAALGNWSFTGVMSTQTKN